MVTYTLDNLPIDQILHGECLSTMKSLPAECVTCIFADPPYNLQLGGVLRRPDESIVDGVDDNWDRFSSYREYDDFCSAWLLEASRILHPDGTIWVIGSYHNIFRLGTLLQDLGFWILNDIIWLKSNPMPNFRGRRFTNAHETVIWAARSQTSRYRFNYHAMKALNDSTQMRSDWYLPICTGNERLKNEVGKKLHPTQKPESLLYRVLLASTVRGDLVLDPFSGTGTTSVIAKRLGRHFIGIEQDAVYYRASCERLANEIPFNNDLLDITPERRDIPRVPFGTFVENGSIPPGTVVTDKQERVAAVVTADGSLKNGAVQGSIHKVGAILTNTPSCNGWTFWYFKREGALVPLDILRMERQEAKL